MRIWLGRLILCLVLVLVQAKLEVNTSSIEPTVHSANTQIREPLLLRAVDLFVEHVAFLVEMNSPGGKPESDPFWGAVLRLRTDQKVRQQLGADLGRLLGDDRERYEEKAGALLVQIQYEFTAAKLASLKLGIQKRLIPEGKMPWPLCIPFGCK